MKTEDVVDIGISFDDGKMIIERLDGKPISLITNEENEECIEFLEFGCAGNAVKALQSLLNCNGQHLNVDGIFGRLTQEALIIFQDQQKLPKTGTCGLTTWEKLIKGY